MFVGSNIPRSKRSHSVYAPTLTNDENDRAEGVKVTHRRMEIKPFKFESRYINSMLDEMFRNWKERVWMTREIKFRVFDKENRKWLDEGEFFITNENVWAYAADFDNSSPLDMEKHELVQYTGLKDKNGTEIYECDIVQTGWQGNEKGVVVFESSTYCVDSGNGYMYFNHPESYEVIGNIHQHSHLLGGVDK